MAGISRGGLHLGTDLPLGEMLRSGRRILFEEGESKEVTLTSLLVPTTSLLVSAT